MNISHLLTDCLHQPLQSKADGHAAVPVGWSETAPPPKWLQLCLINLRFCRLWSGCSQLCDHSPSVVAFKATLIHQDGDRIAASCSPPAISLLLDGVNMALTPADHTTRSPQLLATSCWMWKKSMQFLNYPIIFLACCKEASDLFLFCCVWAITVFHVMWEQHCKNQPRFEPSVVNQ